MSAGSPCHAKQRFGPPPVGRADRVSLRGYRTGAHNELVAEESGTKCVKCRRILTPGGRARERRAAVLRPPHRTAYGSPAGSFPARSVRAQSDTAERPSARGATRRRVRRRRRRCGGDRPGPAARPAPATARTTPGGSRRRAWRSSPGPPWPRWCSASSSHAPTARPHPAARSSSRPRTSRGPLHGADREIKLHRAGGTSGESAAVRQRDPRRGRFGPGLHGGTRTVCRPPLRGRRVPNGVTVQDFTGYQHLCGSVRACSDPTYRYPRKTHMIEHLDGAVIPTGFDVPVEPLRRAAHYTGEPGASPRHASSPRCFSSSYGPSGAPRSTHGPQATSFWS